jgi:hypothetical protein
MTMKKARTSEKGVALTRELRTEYRFDYRKAKPNRFAGQPQEDRVVVVLDADVSEVFQTPDSVNEVLRALIKTMPSRRKGAEAKSRRARTGP